MPQLPYGDFDANSVDERKDFGIIPVGRYRMMATSSQMKAAKDKQTGQPRTDAEFLEIEWDIQSPAEFQGRKLWSRLNLRNPSQKAEQIAHEELGEITRACGKSNIRSSEEIHNISINADIEVEPGQAYTKNGVQMEGKPQNRVAKYLAANGAAPTQRPATAAQTAAPAQANTSGAPTPPWKRK